MLRLVLYVLAVFALLNVLRLVPGVGRVFAVPFLGFFLSAAILSAGIGWWTARTVERRHVKRMARDFAAVDTPHNQGKLGVLLLAGGRARAALPCFERATAGEPEFAEWHHRHGQALLATGDARRACAELERSVALDAGHAFGVPILRLSEARLAAGDAQGAREAAERFEHERGETAESAYRRGLALRALGRGDEARDAFGRVGRLADQHSRGVRKDTTWLRLRAWALARL